MAYRNPLDGVRENKDPKHGPPSTVRNPPELLHESYSGKSTRTPRTKDILTYGTEYYLSEQTDTSGRSISDRIAPFTPINSEFAPSTEPDNSVATATSNFHGVIVDELDRKLKRDQLAASRTSFEDEQAEHQDLTYIDSLQAAHIYQASDKQVVIGQFQPSLSKTNNSIGIKVCRGFDSNFQETGRFYRKANIDKLTDKFVLDCSQEGANRWELEENWLKQVCDIHQAQLDEDQYNALLSNNY
ncbi:hypothetical protein BPAE_0038g00120 [Botrytis paeoniae]|uniref:Uncharacterized protein n=1 Tax=Botrytis paeoniae TaxID=278948 RepID=A0A4Z1FSG9_9HELO|nr:hypothetical protein BPAE_0038g00120 [Botrytis paeoniae]